jgi:hypothetical protein
MPLNRRIQQAAINIAYLTILSITLTCGSTHAQGTKSEPSKADERLNLTEIVVTALVLSFGYAVLTRFQEKH